MLRPVWCFMHAHGVIYSAGDNEQEAKNSAVQQLILKDLPYKSLVTLEWLPLEYGKFLSKLNGVNVLTTNT